MLKIKRYIAGALRSNTYFLYKEGAAEAALIDPARGKDKIKIYADSLGLNITAVLITHGHFDHIYEARAWQTEGASVYVCEADADRLNGGNNLGEAFGIIVPPCKADHIIKDGETVCAAGIDFLVMHTPGHSPGSCCYIAEDCIFSGDTLFAGTVGRTDFEGGNIEDLKKSVKKLFALKGDYTVYPGHEEATTLDAERVGNMILSELQR